MLLRLRSWPLGRWAVLAALAVPAIAANQLGVGLLYGADLYFGSAVAVLALLLLGESGLLVGLAGLLLVPRLWEQPAVLLLSLAELFWLTAFLHRVPDRDGARENGWIVLADILFWILIGLPLAFLLLGAVMNLDPAAVLHLSIRLGVNGAFNAALAFLGFTLVRFLQARTGTDRAVAIHGLTFISLLTAILVPSVLAIVLTVRDLHLQLGQNQLQRLRQAALISAVLKSDSLPALAASRREAGSRFEFRLFDGEGRLLFDSNPGLFGTLAIGYAAPERPALRAPIPPELDLIVPTDVQDPQRAALRGYWCYRTASEVRVKTWPTFPLPPGRQVFLVEPADRGVRQLEDQSARAMGLMAWIVVFGAVAAESLARLVAAQFPDVRSLVGAEATGEERSARFQAGGIAAASARRWRTWVRDLQPILQSLARSEDALQSTREDLRRSEQQRRQLETEVSTLSVIDPISGCCNRREFYRRLDHELRRSERAKSPLSFVCLEIDHLRQIRESYGASMGDEVLRSVASELRSRSRTTDLLCRFGEEQFALLLPACDAPSASRVADLLCHSVAQLEIEHQDCRLSVSLSVGVTALRRGNDDGESLLSRGENALYRAKAEGRNRVVVR